MMNEFILYCKLTILVLVPLLIMVSCGMALYVSKTGGL
jgi:hypothetical protein